MGCPELLYLAACDGQTQVASSDGTCEAICLNLKIWCRTGESRYWSNEARHCILAPQPPLAQHLAHRFLFPRAGHGFSDVWYCIAISVCQILMIAQLPVPRPRSGPLAGLASCGGA